MSGILRAVVFASLTWFAGSAYAQSRFLEIAYTPTKRAQVAIWIESADGTFLRTILLTEAVGLRGIGNRPGALQMNSGFRYPYGRREGVFPVWAHRRAAAPGALQFPRVIFQNRWEGYASRQTRVEGQSGEDSSRDDYFCLSFNDAANDDVDATSCASVFNSDKGRFITANDLAANYAEPYEQTAGTTIQRPLSATSLYPMRRDAIGGIAYDGPDSLLLASTAKMVMPDIDVVTRATAPADTAQIIGFEVPESWPDGNYVIHVEVSTERDFNASYNDTLYPTPVVLNESWDYWSTYGYPYRGQPSIVYSVPFELSGSNATFTTADASGHGELHGQSGELQPIDATITNDATNAPGSGVDRLRITSGRRVAVSTMTCGEVSLVPAVPDFVAEPYDDDDHSHEWATLRFTAVALPDRAAVGYRVKVSTHPITTDEEFVAAEDAKANTLDFQGLDLCPVEASSGTPICPPQGTTVSVDIGKLTFQTRYYVAIRALGPCGTVGPIASAQFETTEIHFTTIAPCFVATAAFGSPMADDVATLRAYRDRALSPSNTGRRFIDAYYAVGPTLARLVAPHDSLRAVARAILRPFVQLAAETRSPRARLANGHEAE